MASNSLTAYRIGGAEFVDAVPSREAEFLLTWFNVSGNPNYGTEATFHVVANGGDPLLLTPYGRAGAAGVETDFVAYSSPVNSTLYTADDLVAWEDVASTNFMYRRDGVTTSIPRPTVSNFTPYGLAISPDRQYAFWGGYGVGNISIQRCTLATGVVDTIKTWASTECDQAIVQGVSADNSYVIVQFQFQAYTGLPTEINTLCTLTMGGVASFYEQYTAFSFRGGRYSGTPGVALRATGTRMVPLPVTPVGYSPETGFIEYTNTAVTSMYPHWSNNGLFGVYQNTGQVHKISGLLNSETISSFTLPDGWLPYSTDTISNDGNVIWGSAQRAMPSGYLPFEYAAYRLNIASGQFDTFGGLQDGRLWYTSDDGGVAMGDLGDGLWLFTNGQSPIGSATTVVTFEEVFFGEGVVNEAYENTTGLGWLGDYTAADGGQWLDIYSSVGNVLTADGLVGLGWFDYIYRTLPVSGGADYFVEMDFLFEEGVHPQAVGLVMGQTQAHLNVSDWDNESPCFTVSMGVSGADLWFQCGYDLGGGLLTTVSDTAIGAAAGSGVATLRAEIKGQYAFFSLNGQPLWYGGLRVAVGPYFGLHVSDLATVAAIRYGHSATPQPDFWQEFVIAKEIQ